MIQFTCTHCQTHLSVPDDKTGQTGRCPKCGHTIQVPPADPHSHRPLMPPARAMERTQVDEIPLADAPSRPAPAQPALTPRAPHGPVMPPDLDNPADDAEIPLADDPVATAKEPLPQPEPLPTHGGLFITPAGDAIVVSFQSSKILDPVTIETIGQELYTLADRQACPKIALDFSNVNFLSSQMLGVLIALRKRVLDRKGRLLLCAVHADLQKVFRIVKLERLLPIVPDRHTALGVLGLP